MTRLHLATLIICALLLPATARPADAQDIWGGDLSLNAIVGGALPYATDTGFVVTRLITPDAGGRSIDLTRGQPFGGAVKEVFDARPQVGLGGRYVLRRDGGAKLAVKAMISAGLERPDGERPMVGLAGISLIF